MSTENYTPPANDFLRVVELPKKFVVLLGRPGGKTFDITPDQGVKLGLALMETCLHLKAQQKKGKFMSTGTIEERVARLCVDHLGVDAAKVTPDARFADDLGADSLDKVELVMAFEEEFAVTIEDEVAETINTVREAVDFITARVA